MLIDSGDYYHILRMGWLRNFLINPGHREDQSAAQPAAVQGAWWTARRRA
jgi:hypothetical protein